jgi:hypothetical protein
LTLWLARFPEARPDSYLFPRHQVGLAGYQRKPYLYDVDLTNPVSEWKSAWKLARRAAGVNYRWHDLRHTFVSRLAENPKVSEQTITALAGHVSKRMLERYSHIRAQAKRDAILAIEDGAQNWAVASRRSDGDTDESGKPLELVGRSYGAGDRFRTDDLVLGKPRAWPTHSYQLKLDCPFFQGFPLLFATCSPLALRTIPHYHVYITST